MNLRERFKEMKEKYLMVDDYVLKILDKIK